MATYLVINHSSVECRSSAPKPYAVVNSTGYIPLSTNTSNTDSKTLKGENGITYRVMEKKTSESTFTSEEYKTSSAYSGTIETHTTTWDGLVSKNEISFSAIQINERKYSYESQITTNYGNDGAAKFSQSITLGSAIYNTLSTTEIGYARTKSTSPNANKTSACVTSSASFSTSHSASKVDYKFTGTYQKYTNPVAYCYGVFSALEDSTVHVFTSMTSNFNQTTLSATSKIGTYLPYRKYITTTLEGVSIFVNRTTSYASETISSSSSERNQTYSQSYTFNLTDKETVTKTETYTTIN